MEVGVAKIGVDRHGELLREVLLILSDEDGGLPAKEVLSRVEMRLVLTEHEAGTYDSTNRRRFDKIVRFSTISAVKAGWLNKSKGHWTVTDEGRAALTKFSKPGDLIREAGRLYRLWRKTQPSAPDQVDELEDDHVETSSILEEAEEQAWEAISRYISEINPSDLESLVEALVEAMGYHVLWKATGGADGGIDLIAFNDPLGTTSPRIKVQVKRRADRINVDGLRAFLSVMGHDDVGIFVATGGFTSEAMRLAREQENRKVTLIDLQKLFDLWVEHYDSLPEERRRLLPLTTVHFLALD